MKQRIITAIIGIIIVLPIILYGSWPFILTIFLLATVGLYELSRMFKMTNWFYFSISALFLWAFIYLQHSVPEQLPTFNVVNLIILYMVLLLLFMVFSKNKFTLDDASRMILSLLFIGFSFQFMIDIRMIGLHVFLYVLFV